MKQFQDTHGGNSRAVAARLGLTPEQVLDLSSNTFAACSALTAETLAAVPYPFAAYPDPEAARLIQAIAHHEGCEPCDVIAGNGAAELIWLLFLGLRPRRVVMLGPIFSEYARACDAFGIPYTLVTPSSESGFSPSETDYAALAASPADCAIVCSPNNPGAIAYSDMRRLFESLGTRTIIMDMSYRDFLHGTPLYACHTHQGLRAFVAADARLISLHSLTKFYCCPGIRLGYALADAEIVARMRGLRAPWMLTDFAGEIGSRLLERTPLYREMLPDLRQHVRMVARKLGASQLFEASRIFEGVSFVTALVQSGYKAATLRDALLDHGVVVRLCDTIPGMPPGFLRIQARDPETMRPFHAALACLSGLARS